MYVGSTFTQEDSIAMQLPQYTQSCVVPMTMLGRQGYNASYISPSRANNYAPNNNNNNNIPYAHSSNHVAMNYCINTMNDNTNSNNCCDGEFQRKIAKSGGSGRVGYVKPTDMHAKGDANEQLLYAVPHNHSDTNIFLRHLPTRIDDNTLRCMSEPFGHVVSAAVMRDIYTGESLGTAFVRFARHDDARAALRYFMNYNGGKRALVAQWAKKQHDDAIVGEARYKKKKLFVRNVPTDVTEAAMEQLMQVYGTIENVTLHADTVPAPNVQSKTPYHARYTSHSAVEPPSLSVSTLAEEKERRLIAFVTFVQTGAAAAACDAVHNTFPFPSCKGIPLMTKLAESNSQRKAQHQSNTNYRQGQCVANVNTNSASNTNITANSNSSDAGKREEGSTTTVETLGFVSNTADGTVAKAGSKMDNSMSMMGRIVSTNDAMMSCDTTFKPDDHQSSNQTNNYLVHQVYDHTKNTPEQDLLSESCSLSSLTHTSHSTTMQEDVSCLSSCNNTSLSLSSTHLVCGNAMGDKVDLVAMPSQVHAVQQSNQHTSPNNMCGAPPQRNQQLADELTKQPSHLHTPSYNTSPALSSMDSSVAQMGPGLTTGNSTRASSNAEMGSESRNSDETLSQEGRFCTANLPSVSISRFTDSLERQYTETSQIAACNTSAIRDKPAHKVSVKIRHGKYYCHNPYDTINTRIYYL